MNDTNNKLTRLPLFVVHPLNISPQYIYQIVICLSFQVSVLPILREKLHKDATVQWIVHRRLDIEIRSWVLVPDRHSKYQTQAG